MAVEHSQTCERSVEAVSTYALHRNIGRISSRPREVVGRHRDVVMAQRGVESHAERRKPDLSAFKGRDALLVTPHLQKHDADVVVTVGHARSGAMSLQSVASAAVLR